MAARQGQRLNPHTLAEIDAAEIRPGRPLLVVDADEVLVAFSAHLARWLNSVGYELRLTRYELEGSIYALGDETPVAFEAALSLIDAFFEDETVHQQPLAGAVEALERLRREAQVVVLTNIPRPARDDRVTNLLSHGLDIPVIANQGGKGRALAIMAARAAAPSAFIDDSPHQIVSAARHAPDMGRIHFRGSPFIQPVLQAVEGDHDTAASWPEAETMIRRHLAL
ncbi:MAG: hypothetical protein AAF577_09985 [Pseudomonadota bacterium]